ncbi:hypothetical protein GGR01_000996 [Acetobacter oeni]|nr:hypothetical protein [Acetobacter oeni]
MSKDTCTTGGCCAPKKGCCSLKKIVGLVVFTGIAGLLWKKFRKS